MESRRDMDSSDSGDEGSQPRSYDFKVSGKNIANIPTFH